MYVKEHPVDKWSVPTSILYGAKDNLQSRDVIDDFVSRFNCRLTVAEDSEHAFMGEGDKEIVEDWIKAALVLREDVKSSGAANENSSFTGKFTKK